MKLEIGQVYQKDNGQLLYLTGGSYFGRSGNVSNFWYWTEIGNDGSVGKKDSGYGKEWDHVPTKQDDTYVTLPNGNKFAINL